MTDDIQGIEALKRAIEIAGSQQALAIKISTPDSVVTQQAISWWLTKSGRVPAEKAMAIESAVQGKITRKQLRPDIFQ